MIVPIFLPHLGCGQRCVYCNQEIITENTGVHGLEQRIASLLDPVNVPVEVALYGGNPLGLSHESLESLLSLFDPFQDKITQLRISARPGPVSARCIGILKRHRVRTVELGTPTFNDRLLDRLSRGHTADDSCMTIELMKEEGFETGMQVMVGLPGETRGDIEELVRAISTLTPAFIRIYPLVVIEETPLLGWFDSGSFVPDTLDEAVAKAAFVYASAWAEGIRTIKIGLTENKGLKARIAAGPYHPAFGYLAKSEAFCVAVTNKCERSGIRRDVHLRVHPSDVAHLVGHKRSGLEKLKRELGSIAWSIEPSLRPGHFLIEAGGGSVEASLADGLARTRA